MEPLAPSLIEAETGISSVPSSPEADLTTGLPAPEGSPLEASTSEGGTAGEPSSRVEGGGESSTRVEGGEEPSSLIIREGDFVILLSPDNKRLTVRAGQGQKGTHYGQVDLVSLVGMQYGRAARTNMGHPVYLLRPTLQDHIMSLKRITQIIYPKDIGTILLKLGIGQGSRVLECGTGSGALTLAMAWMVGPTGRIYSYEREKAHHERARYNLTRVGLMDRVELKLRDLSQDRFDETSVDAAFLDVREPPDILHRITESLSPGGVLGFLLPTANQVSDVLRALEQAPYIDTEVMETFFRKYKVNAARLRPEDRMIGHTGYLVFTRRIVQVPDFVLPPKVKATKIAAGELEMTAALEPPTGIDAAPVLDEFEDLSELELGVGD